MREQINAIKEAGRQRSVDQWKEFRSRLEVNQIGGGISFEERLAQAMAEKLAAFRADSQKMRQLLADLQKSGFERSMAQWKEWRSALEDSQLGGGMSFDQRIENSIREKRKAANDERKKMVELLKGCRDRGAEKSMEEWKSFREYLEKSELGGGISFDERVAQAMAEKLKNFREEGIKGRQLVAEAIKKGREKADEQWTEWRSRLNDVELGGGMSFDERIEMKIVEKKKALAASSRQGWEGLQETKKSGRARSHEEWHRHREALRTMPPPPFGYPKRRPASARRWIPKLNKYVDMYN
jgi:hypothetical protein